MERMVPRNSRAVANFYSPKSQNRAIKTNIVLSHEFSKVGPSTATIYNESRSTVSNKALCTPEFVTKTAPKPD